MTRNFSVVEYVNRLAEERRPALSFFGGTRAEWATWREQFLDRLRTLCGEWPEAVPLDAETVERRDEGAFAREKVVLQTERHMSIPAYVLVPVDRRRARTGRLPAILCLHGHGPFGKDPVAGVEDAARPALAGEITRRNYDFAAQMARDGYVTMAPDARGYGELADGGNPYPGRDVCDVHFIRSALVGVYLLTLHLWDAMKCLDYLAARADVDRWRLGVMGFSWGGTRSMFLAALDERVRATSVICALSQLEHFAIHDAEICGAEFLPHLLRYGDLADVAGLIAPRPLLIENGLDDTTYPVGPVQRAHEHLRRIYQAAGAADRLEIDLFPGGHQFHGPAARAFFERSL
jgi:dienelactone hydrolase